MATIVGYDASLPVRKQEKGVFTIVKTYEASAVADGDVVQLCPVAAGTTVLDGFVVCDAMGGSTSIKVGDGDDDDYFLASVSISSAAKKTFSAATAFPKTYTADDTVDYTITGAASTGTVTMVLYCTAETVDLT